ncbi:MAG: hypothetical protein D6725_06405 [Planctomycetota bacterium]|nr:MAG: hypothetical protein D6725_06405 [Planctomycetota bacterium]
MGSAPVAVAASGERKPVDGARKAPTYCNCHGRWHPVAFPASVAASWPCRRACRGQGCGRKRRETPRSVMEAKKSRFAFAELVRRLTRAVTAHPIAVLVAAALTMVLAVTYTAVCIEFRTDRSDLISQDADYQKRWLDYTRSFGASSEIVVVVEAPTPQMIKQILDELGAALEQEPELFSSPLYKVDAGALANKGLQYLSPAELAAALERIEELRPVLDGQWEQLTLEAMFSNWARRVQESIRARAAAAIRRFAGGSAGSAPEPVASVPAGTGEAARGSVTAEAGATSAAGPEGDLGARRREGIAQVERLVDSLLRYLDQPNEFVFPWGDSLSLEEKFRRAGRQVVYLLNDTGTMGFLRVYPVRQDEGFAGAERSIRRLRDLAERIRHRHPEVRIGLTGIPVLEHDEMQRSQRDMTIASIFSTLGVGVLLIVGLRGLRHPLVALATLVVGMALAFGYTTLAVGHLNILSVSFAAILIGLGIDFAIHYLARYLQLRHEGYGVRDGLIEASGEVGSGVATAAVTTALAFFCAGLTDFLGVAELGIIAGGGVLICAVTTFLVVPALVMLVDDRWAPGRLPTPFQAERLRHVIFRFPRLVLGGSAAILLLAASWAFEWRDGALRPVMHYDSNLLHLQAEGLESVEVQQRVFEESARSGGAGSLLFAVSMADTPEQARELRRRFEALPTVSHVEELASRFPAFPAEETKLYVQAFHALLANLPPSPPRLPAPDPARVGRAAEDFYRALQRVPYPEVKPVIRKLDRFLERFASLSLQEQMAVVEGYQRKLVGAIHSQLAQLAAVCNPEPVSVSDLPAELAHRFVSPQGRWLLQIFPKEQIWDDEPLERFVRDVRSVDPQVTGTPLQNYEAARQIRESYMNAAVYAFVVIGIVLLVDFLGTWQAVSAVGITALVMGVGLAIVHSRGVPPDWPTVALATLITISAVAAVLDFHAVVDMVLALLPPVAGAVLMLGLLDRVGVSLNPANLIVMPLVLGIGVDDGVHVLHDFRARLGGDRLSASTFNAIVLTSLTSMIGFGSMMLSAHRGLYSVGLVLVVGVGSCLFISLVLLPAALQLLPRGVVVGGDGEITDGGTAAQFAAAAGDVGAGDRTVESAGTPRREQADDGGVAMRLSDADGRDGQGTPVRPPAEGGELGSVAAAGSGISVPSGVPTEPRPADPGRLRGYTGDMRRGAGGDRQTA